MAQLVGGVPLIVKIAVPQGIVNYLLDASVCDACAALAEEECVRLDRRFFSFFNILNDRIRAGVVYMDYAFLVALSQQTHSTLVQVHVLKIESNKFAETHSAVEEKGYDTVIPVVIRIAAVHVFKQLYAVV